AEPAESGGRQRARRSPDEDGSPMARTSAVWNARRPVDCIACAGTGVCPHWLRGKGNAIRLAARRAGTRVLQLPAAGAETWTVRTGVCDGCRDLDPCGLESAQG